MRFLIPVLVLAVVAACNPTNPSQTFDRVPAELLPPVTVVAGELEPAGTPEQYQAFVEWVAEHRLTAGDDDNPDKPVVGPSYCRDVTETLSWCTQADGRHHWMTPSGCYDLNGTAIACW